MKTRDQVLKEMEELKEIEKDIEDYKSRLEYLEHRATIRRLKCRMSEVDYVLDHVLQKMRSDSINKKDIDTYLVHCMNKLHGNIDSVVLNFEEENK